MAQEDHDEKLVERAQQGDRQAFMALYDRYFDKVYNRVRSKVPPSDVEDVTQEIFIAVLHALEQFEHRSKFNTWLYTIVRRKIADFYRRDYQKDAQVLHLEEQLEAPSVDFNQGRIHDRVRIQRALNAVPAHYQEVILLRFVDGLAFREIAESIEKSLDATKSLYRRAIQAVRDELDKPYDQKA